jgi:hypothetical protein
MRDIIKKQLENVKVADLSNFDENNAFIIPKKEKSLFNVGDEYIVELSDDLLLKGKNDILESNYNHGKVPECKQLHGEVQNILGKLVFFIGCGYDDGDNDIFWKGYLPKDKIKIIKKFN